MSFCTQKSESPTEKSEDIPKSVRILCIFQLCIAFSVLLWIVGIPFTEHLYEYRKTAKQLEWLIDLHPEKYETVSLPEKELLEQMRETAQKGLQESFRTKLVKSIELLLLETNTSQLAWLLLAATLSIMIMKQKEGVREAVWILPLLAFLYSVQMGSVTEQMNLYPSESYLEEHYMGSPMSSSWEEQRTQLEAAWQNYLAKEWSILPIESDTRERFADGLYRFTLKKTIAEWNSPPEKPGPWTMGCYVLWNLFFAGFVFRKLRGRQA